MATYVRSIYIFCRYRAIITMLKLSYLFKHLCALSCIIKSSDNYAYAYGTCMKGAGALACTLNVYPSIVGGGSKPSRLQKKKRVATGLSLST